MKTFQSLIALPEEKVLLMLKKHWIILLVPCIIIPILTVAFLSISYLVFYHVLRDILLVSIASILILTTMTSLAVKAFIEWYFHLYIISNRRVMELCYAPLSSCTLSDVLLDSVRCTEVDVHVKGILGEILDVGDVTLTFDRPTHQQEFTLSYISRPTDTSMFLAYQLNTIKSLDSSFWNKSRVEPSKLIFTENITSLKGHSWIDSKSQSVAPLDAPKSYPIGRGGV